MTDIGLGSSLKVVLSFGVGFIHYVLQNESQYAIRGVSFTSRTAARRSFLRSLIVANATSNSLLVSRWNSHLFTRAR